MKIPFFTISLIFLLNYQIKSTISTQKTERDSLNCQPDCSNLPKPECNFFEIELRTSMAKCTYIKSIFAKSTTSRSTNIEETPDITLKCNKKLTATLKIVNQGETSTLNQYIIIDHVIDGTTGRKVSLLNPYVIVFKQKPILQMYGLKFRSMVNGEAKENVYNKRSPNFTGCSDNMENSICGYIKHNEQILPYSQGFCCSCDDKINEQRQTRSLMTGETKKVNIPKNFQDFLYEYMKKTNYNDNQIYKKKTIKSKFKMVKKSKSFGFNNCRKRYGGNIQDNQIFYVSPRMLNKDHQPEVSYPKDTFFNQVPQSRELNDYYDDDGNFESSTEEKKRHAPQNIQIRGGQNCDDTWSQSITNDLSNSSKDSAHCLEFSQLWYGIYQLSEPLLEHTIYLRIFEKRESEDGAALWFDLTSGHTITIGSLNRKYIDSKQSILITYDNVLLNGLNIPFSLDPKTKRILIPQKEPPDDKENSNEFPESEKGAPEYLVIDSKSIDTSGGQCDSVGVGYEAFFNQPDRCAVPKGTCLKNQPSQLWRSDKIACKRKKRGKYFLKNYARVPENALRETRKGDSKYLALYYSQQFKSNLEIEVRADDNMIFQSKPIAKITEVYIDATSDAITVLTIKIHNNGLTSNLFHPRLRDCPFELPVDWGNLEGDSVIIPPQHHSTFTLRLLGVLPVRKFFCTVEALNSKNEIIAVRRVHIIKRDRCICSWHCLCACVKATGLACILMSIDHYKAAGFIGSMPLTTNMVQSSYFESALFGCFYFTALFTCILLLMGLTKGIIGLCFFIPVGVWGLDMIIGVRPIPRYYERRLRNRQVVYDSDGWPIHPDTYQRTVRIVPDNVEFCLNLIFFFTYPIMLVLVLCAKICCPFYTFIGDEDKGVCFKGVSAIVYSKCPDVKAEKDSESDAEYEDQFDFEEVTSSKRSYESRRSSKSREISSR